MQSDGTEYLNGWSTAIVDTLPGYPMNITAGRFETVYHNLTDGFLKYRLVYLDNGFNEIQATDLSEGMTEIVSSRFVFDQPATSSATDEIKPSVNIRMTANPTMQGQFAAFFAPEGTDITSVTAPTWTSLFFPAGSLGLRVSADGFTPGQAGTIRWVYNEVSFGSNTSTEAGTTVVTAAVVTPTTPTTPGPDVTTPGDVDAPVIITPAIVDAPVAAPVKTTSEKHLASTGADASPLTVMAGLMLLIGAALARFRRRVAR